MFLIKYQLDNVNTTLDLITMITDISMNDFTTGQWIEHTMNN